MSDQKSAKDCIQENEILRCIAGHCIEETGGLFVQLEGDSDEYFQEKLEGCAECGIPTEVISREEALAQEPRLTSEVKRAIRVPDHAIDPFRLCVANAADAIEHGARIETHSEVIDMHAEDERVTGVTIRRQGPNHRGEGIEGETETIEADHVVSATGAWAGQLADMVDIDVEMAISKGAMVVTNVRQVDTVINRCLPKNDGDTIIPHETTVLLGANDDQVDDPDDYPEEQWEIDLMIDIASEMIPAVRNARMIRAYWGVRPLFDPEAEPDADPEAKSDLDPDSDTNPEKETKEMGEITRDYSVLDHAERDGVEGFTTIVGGKLTTYREMAEAVTDHVCEIFGVEAACRTHERALPGSRDPAILDDYMDRFGLRSPIAKRSAKRLGEKAPDVLDTEGPNPIVCSCEAVTRAEIQDSIAHTGADLNAVRIRTRASMGNCQGGFCCHRMAAEVYPTRDDAIARDALDELYQERWKGQRHTLWGEQLSQAMLNHLLHATTMNQDADPSFSEDTIDFEAFDTGESEETTETETGEGGDTRQGATGAHGD